ncbi:MAG: methyltransferase domain-containing protein [bacterium]|nr:methyltransferase domain-containing protein [bacterium]
MDVSAYAIEARLGGDHWWFEGRRRVLRGVLSTTDLPADPRIYDVGCGSGQNLDVWRSFGDVVAVDPSPVALEWCRDKYDGVLQGTLECLPMASDSVSWLVATDVLEHLEDDAAGAREIARVLTPRSDSLAVVTVPAFAWLWGVQDDATHHFRRYTRAQFRHLLLDAGLRIERLTYFNTLLLPPIALGRLFIRLTGLRPESENNVNAPGVNALLKAVFSSEVAWLRHFDLPAGVSLLALVRKA